MGNQPYITYLDLNIANNKKYDEGTALLNIHVGAGYKRQQVVQAPDDTERSVSPEMIAQTEDEIAISGYLMTKYSLKAGMHQFGSQAEDVAITELTQLHVMNTWIPEDHTKLSGEVATSALRQWDFTKRVYLKGRSRFSHSSD